MCVCTCIYIRNWLTWLYRLVNPKSAEQAAACDAKNSWCCISGPKAISLEAEFLFLRGLWSFLSRRLTDWMRLTYIMEGEMPYWNLTNLNINCILKKYLYSHFQTVVWPQTGSWGLARVTHKINHHPSLNVFSVFMGVWANNFMWRDFC